MLDKEKETKKPRNKNFGLWLGSVIILVLIIVTFVGGPLLGQAATRRSLVFGYYKRQPVEFTQDSYFFRQIQSISQRQDQSGQDIQRDYQIFREAFENTILHKAILDKAKNQGLHISTKLIDSTIVQYGPYREAGRFSPRLYEETPEAQRIETRNRFEKSLIEDQFRTYVFSNALSSSSEIDFLKSMGTNERQLDFVVFEADLFPEERILNYGQEQASLFQKLSLKSLTVSNESKAEELVTKLNEDPGAFDYLARTESIDSFADSGGFRGTVYYHELNRVHDKTTVDGIMALKPGQTSPAIDSNGTWIIYQSNGELRPADFSQSDDFAELKNYFQTHERAQLNDYLSELADEFRANALETSLSEAAEKKNVAVYQTNYFPINYGSVFLFPNMRTEDRPGVFGDISRDKALLSDIFSLRLGGISQPTAVDGGILIFSTADVRVSEIADDGSSMFLYWDYILQQWITSSFKESVLASEYVRDDFTRAFMQMY